MSLPSIDRDALRKSLHAALNDSLVDVDGEYLFNSSLSMSAPFGAGQFAFASAMPSPTFHAWSFLPSASEQSVFLQIVGLPASSSVRAPISAHAGLTDANANQLLLQAAKEEFVARQNQDRTALLCQQLLQNSYQARLRIKLAAVNASNYQQISQTQLQVPFSQAAYLPNMQLSYVSNSSSTVKALEALGSSLRESTDPYIDVSCVEDKTRKETQSKPRTRGGVTEPFPEKLHRMLKEVEESGESDIVSFFSHGRAFAVRDMDRFVDTVMPRFFKQSKWNSFARQLNLYGFVRLQTGPDSGGYYHELFLKGRPSLCLHMRRVGVPQGKDRRKFKPQNRAVEPDFYSMKKISETS